MILKGYSNPRLLSFGIPSMIIVIIFSLMKTGEGPIFSLLIYLGNASYSIYIVHCFFFYAREFVNKHIYINQDLSGIFFSFFSVLCGCLFYSFVEKRITQKIKNVYFNKKNKRLISTKNAE